MTLFPSPKVVDWVMHDDLQNGIYEALLDTYLQNLLYCSPELRSVLGKR
jgi:hypothetical protein